MTERDSFLRAVCESPADDTVRLVFADWLEEHGEPERAEFIRMQLGHIEYNSERFPALARAFFRGQPSPVRGDGSVSFSKGHPGYAAKYRFTGCGPLRFWAHRGFVSRVETTIENILKHSKDIFPVHPIDTVKLPGLSPALWTAHTELNGMYFWYDRGDFTNYTHSHHVPRELCPLTEGLRPVTSGPYEMRYAVFFPTEAEAWAALSRRCIAYGRKLAGLPPLPLEAAA